MDESKFLPIRRSWVSDTSDMRTCYLGMTGRVSVRKLLDHIKSAAHASVDINNVMLNFATATWKEPSTGAEREERQQQLQARKERTEEWERKTYERLKEKFEK